MTRTSRRLVVTAALLACAGCSSPATPAPATTTPAASPTAATTTTTTTTTSATPTTTVPVVVPATTTTEDPVPVVGLGEYCSPAGATATTSDGSLAYCSRLAGTDSYQWDLSPGVVPNPRLTPTVPPVAVGSYCPTPKATATTPDGSTVYCERVQATDGYQWSLTPGLIPNPRLTTTTAASSPSAGDDCYDPDGVAVDAQGRTLYCNPTVNGRLAGNLLYQLLP